MIKYLVNTQLHLLVDKQSQYLCVVRNGPLISTYWEEVAGGESVHECGRVYKPVQRQSRRDERFLCVCVSVC